jgi:hypothetical protein
MKLDLAFLYSASVCPAGREWYIAHKEPDTVERCVATLKRDKENPQALSWANWLLAKTMTTENCQKYAIFAAKQVIQIYEKKYPRDSRPRQAIEAAEKYLNEPTEDNKNAAYAAAAAADATAYAAAAAADAAADAAGAAADAAGAAADSAYAAASSAHAAYAAAHAADAAVDAARGAAPRRKIQLEIINYGLNLLKAQV